VADVLERLHGAALAQDGRAKERVRAREAELGERLPQSQRYELYADAPLAIKRPVGELLYLLTLGRPHATVVEFGSSLGISTIYLAAALRDAGHGTLITTELRPSKAQAARRNLIDAGLDDLVEIRIGDARDTLRELPARVDVLFLDGSNDLYLDILRLVERRLAPNALIAADLSAEDPDLDPYLQHVRDRAKGYVSVLVPLDDGVELSVRARD
jgi:predicted O-methyltransferase YrrM